MAGLAALVAPAGILATQQRQRSPAVTLEDFGGGIDVDDNTAAMVTAFEQLAAQRGGLLNFGEGTYRFASSSLAKRGGMEVPANVELAGRGRDATLLAITGASQCHFLVNEEGGSGHFMHDLSARGNGIAHANGPGGFYYCSLLAGRASADVTNCRFADLRLENFGGDFWIRFYCTSPDHVIRGCGMETGCEAISAPGNARGPDNLGITSYVIEFRGDGGKVADCFVRGLYAQLTWIKGGVAAFGRVDSLSITDVVLKDAFGGYRVPDRGGYALLLYDTGPQDVVTGTIVERPVISAPFSCGIYLAGTRGTQILDPVISGQTDAADDSLPKAAVSFNGANGSLLRNAQLTNNAYDIQIAGISGPEYNSQMNLRIEGGSGEGARLAGIKLRSSPFARQCGGIAFQDYRSETAKPGASGMVWQLHPDFQDTGVPSGIYGLNWTGGTCSGGPSGYDMNLNVGSNADNPSGNVNIIDVKLGGMGVRGSLVAVGCKGGDIRLSNVMFVGEAGHHIMAERCARLVLEQVDFAGSVSKGRHVILDRTPYVAHHIASQAQGRWLQITG